MKRVLIALVIILGTAAAVSAQPKAIGIRFGYGAELSYKHNLNGANFIEGNLGLDRFVAGNVAVTYNWMIAQPAWTDRGDWGFYLGTGPAVGFGEYLSVGLAGQCGLEYEFWFPLQISIDIRPQLGLVNQTFGVWGWYPNLSFRYTFQ